MTDAGTDGKLYPFTFWLSEEDWNRLTRIMEKTGVTDENKIVAAGLWELEDEFDRWGFVEQLTSWADLVNDKDRDSFTKLQEETGLDRFDIIRGGVSCYLILCDELKKEDPENAWKRLRSRIGLGEAKNE